MNTRTKSVLANPFHEAEKYVLNDRNNKVDYFVSGW